MSNYDDIIHLPHPTSKKHRRMSLDGRAAQFGAFRALTGHEEAVEEVERYTENKPELSENDIEILNEKLKVINNRIKEGVSVKITYFVPDKKKQGGAYKVAEGEIQKIDLYKHVIVMVDKTEIYIDMITEIESDIFNNIVQ